MKDRFDVHLGVTNTLFIGKWTVRVLFLLKERPYRHAQLRRRLGPISQRMLTRTRTLRNLESNGLICRKVTQSRSVTVRLHRNVLAIALANKLARIAWGVLAGARTFEASKLQTQLRTYLCIALSDASGQKRL
jgi:DNA-binding HxlR family transcriptional regulator